MNRRLFIALPAALVCLLLAGSTSAPSVRLIDVRVLGSRGSGRTSNYGLAPGTRITSLEAQNSYISSTYRQWHVAGSGKNAYLRLTGWGNNEFSDLNYLVWGNSIGGGH